MYYYGVKLHALAFYKKGSLPMPERVVITPASESDLNVFRDNWSKLSDRIFVADKIYQSKDSELCIDKLNSELLSPIKYSRVASEDMKKFNRAHDDLFNRGVSAIRQPIESIFSSPLKSTSNT